MSRPLRLEFSGALYHITSRGNRRELIYEDDKDRQTFLAILSDVCISYNWVCHAYCLMDNHYHLLIETPEPNLSRGMRQLNGVYSQCFNSHHRRVGHVFQGRYKSILVDKDSYLLELSRYIVLNPVRALMVDDVEDWVWSSYQPTVGLCRPPNFLHVDGLLAHFSSRKLLAIECYKKFVAQGKEESSPLDQVKNQIYLGDEQFVERVQDLVDFDSDLSEVPVAQSRAINKTLIEYQQSYTSRDEAIVGAYLSGGYTLKEVGDFFGIHYSRVSRIVKKAKRKT